MNVVPKSFKITSFPVLLSAFVSIVLLLYSFTQADLNLPISDTPLISLLETIINYTGFFGSNFTFQHIGYFERPLSTNLYISTMIGSFCLYGLFLYLCLKNTLTARSFAVSVGVIATILLWSYPAFSYDIFNYMFDARIVTKFQENPYLHKALDYPQDPWLNIMRWTHRTYPYGPIWLIVTVPLSYIGFQDFGLTLYLFKLLMVGSYIGSTYFIYKILAKLDKKHALFGAVFFAFNPLVIVESLISAHNDIVMIFLALWAYYLLVQKKRLQSILLLFLSIGMKFATIFLTPLFLLELYPKKFEISFEKKIMVGIGCMALAVVAASIRTQFQPWYLLYVFPFAALISKEKWVQMPVFIFSAAALGMYIPYLYTGNWNPPIPVLLNQLLAGACILSVIYWVFWLFKKRSV